MIINQKTEFQHDLIDFPDSLKSDRYSISKSNRLRKNNDVRYNFDKELKKSLKRKNRKNERLAESHYRTNEAIKTKRNAKAEEVLKTRQINRKNRVGARIVRKETNDQIQPNAEDKGTEDHPDMIQGKQAQQAVEKKHHKEIQKDPNNPKKGCASDKTILIQTKNMPDEKKLTAFEQNVMPAAEKKQKNGLELVQPSTLNDTENKTGKDKTGKSDRLVDKQSIELKMETGTDAKSRARKKITFNKTSQEKLKIFNTSEHRSAENEVKIKEITPNSNKIIRMDLHSESKNTEKNQSTPNTDVTEIKSNALEFMASSRTPKIDTGANFVFNNESLPDKLLPEQSIDKIIKNLIYIVKNKQSEIKIDLRPELLGDMRIEILMKNNRVNIAITTASNNIKELVENSLSQLRAEFTNNKIFVDSIEVSVNNESLKENGKQKNNNDRHFSSNKNDFDNNEKQIVENGSVDEIQNRPKSQNGMIDYYV